MKLHTGLGPNPRTVKMFIAEKGIDVPRVEVDLMAGDNRRPPYTDKNPAGQLPCLELDDGTFLSEILPICEYLEEKHPRPALVGSTPEERAATRMWARRIDLNIVEPISNGFRYGEGLMLFKDRIRTIPQASDDLKALGARSSMAATACRETSYIAGNRLRSPTSFSSILRLRAHGGHRMRCQLIVARLVRARRSATERRASS